MVAFPAGFPALSVTEYAALVMLLFASFRSVIVRE
jgi:hypothetical protein